MGLKQFACHLAANEEALTHVGHSDHKAGLPIVSGYDCVLAETDGLRPLLGPGNLCQEGTCDEDLQDGGEEGNPRGTAMCQAAGQPVQSGGQRPSGRKLLRAMERTEYLMHLNVLLGIETLIEVFEVKFIRVHRKPRKQK